jgi:hypothetical protein
MAITAIAPDAGPQPIPDPVTFEEAAAALQGDPASPSSPEDAKRVANKLYRWAREDGLTLERRGRAWTASYTDLLDAHERRHPAPRR